MGLNQKGEIEMKTMDASEGTSRREFARSVATAFVVAPLITSQTEGETKPPDGLGIRRDDSQQPARQEKQQEKPKILMEHIPPILIGDGSFEMETMDNLPDDSPRNPAPIPGTGRRKWKYFLYPVSTIIERVKIISKDGNVADVNLSEDGGQIRIWLQERVIVGGSARWEPATTGEPHILLDGLSFTMEIDQKLFRHPDEVFKPRHRFRHKHPDGLTPGNKPLRIARVSVIRGSNTLYDNTSEEGYLLMIWKHT